MRTALNGVLIALTIGVLVGTAALWLTVFGRGFTARGDPSVAETIVARRVRRLAIPNEIADATNPQPASPEVLGEALAHFADHCASCHANDGSGNTGIGRNLYPPAPDMQQEATQSLSDGELFYLIHNGVPFTGMPAWGDGDFSKDEDSWKLVHFIRHLPRITEKELARMKGLNPKSSHELEEEGAIRDFLTGRPAPSNDHRRHTH